MTPDDLAAIRDRRASPPSFTTRGRVDDLTAETLRAIEQLVADADSLLAEVDRLTDRPPTGYWRVTGKDVERMTPEVLDSIKQKVKWATEHGQSFIVVDGITLTWHEAPVEREGAVRLAKRARIRAAVVNAMLLSDVDAVTANRVLAAIDGEPTYDVTVEELPDVVLRNGESVRVRGVPYSTKPLGGIEQFQDEDR